MKKRITLMRKRIKYAVKLYEAQLKLTHLSKLVANLKSFVSPIYAEFYEAKNDVEKYTRIIENMNRNGR